MIGNYATTQEQSDVSHTQGKVRFPTGEIFWVAYDSTNDALEPRLWGTADELAAHLRELTPPAAYTPCAHPKDEVEIAVKSEGGLQWSGTACRLCRLVEGPLDVWEIETVGGLPEWY
jgi:hypothetical protein